jgi:hypothetical protein
MFYRNERSEDEKVVRNLMLKADRQEIAMLAYQQAEVRAHGNLFGNDAACDIVACQITHKILEERS